MRNSIIGITRSETQALQLINQLRSANFPLQDISIILLHEKNSLTGNTSIHPQRESSSITHKASWESESGEIFEDEKIYSKRSAIPSPQEKTIQKIYQAPFLKGPLGKLSHVGHLKIPEIGTFIAAGPLKIALSLGSCAKHAGSLGLLVGTFVGLGLSESTATQLEERLKKGLVLVSLQTRDDKELTRAKDIFKHAGAHDVVMTENKVKSTQDVPW